MGGLLARYKTELRTLAGIVTPKTYEVRADSNRYHDRVFLASLIHDARVSRRLLLLRGNRLTIPLERDCWELGWADDSYSYRLHIARSRLTIEPVVSIHWEFDHDGPCAKDDELWIVELWIESSLMAKIRHVYLIGDTWRCKIELADHDFRIRLRDLETPYLDRERRTP